MTTPDTQSRLQPDAHIGTAMLVGVVLAVATVFAASMLAEYAANPEQLWREVNHDRNGHFNFGLDVALALKSLDPIDFLKQIVGARVWPPVHGLAPRAGRLTVSRGRDRAAAPVRRGRGLAL